MPRRRPLGAGDGATAAGGLYRGRQPDRRDAALARRGPPSRRRQRMMRPGLAPQLYRLGLGGAVCLVLVACSAPPYDEQTDRLISALQSDVDSQIVMLLSLDRRVAELSGANNDLARKSLAEARARAGYDANAAFYDKLDSQLTSLRLRVDALPTEANPICAMKDDCSTPSFRHC